MKRDFMWNIRFRNNQENENREKRLNVKVKILDPRPKNWCKIQLVFRNHQFKLIYIYNVQLAINLEILSHIRGSLGRALGEAWGQRSGVASRAHLLLRHGCKAHQSKDKCAIYAKPANRTAKFACVAIGQTHPHTKANNEFIDAHDELSKNFKISNATPYRYALGGRIMHRGVFEM